MKQAARALLACRTCAMGGHYQVCPDGHDMRICYHACRHRSCPRCHALPKANWVAAQHAKLLACDHYHVVFTLPHELLRLWRYNRHWFTKAMFAASRDTLFDLLGDERYLGATPGVIMAFHSWGRTLSLHPHVHCLVTGGGWSAAGRWRAVNNGYLLPAKVAKAVYRGKLLSAVTAYLSEGDGVLPAGETLESLRAQLRKLYTKEWNVRIQERYAHGQGVMLYLSRYIKGGPIEERRIRYRGGDTVDFAYTDHRDHQRKMMHLRADAFMTRILTHVPEPGQHQVRHYGLYHAKQQAKRSKVRVILGQSNEAKRPDMHWADYLIGQKRAQSTVCQQCGAALVSRYHFGRNKNSFIRVPTRMAVADLSNKPLERTLSGDGGPLFFARGAPLN